MPRCTSAARPVFATATTATGSRRGSPRHPRAANRIGAHRAGLQPAQHRAAPLTTVAAPFTAPSMTSASTPFQSPRSRCGLDRLDDGRVVELVHVVLVQQQSIEPVQRSRDGVGRRRGSSGRRTRRGRCRSARSRSTRRISVTRPSRDQRGGSPIWRLTPRRGLSRLGPCSARRAVVHRRRARRNWAAGSARSRCCHRARRHADVAREDRPIASTMSAIAIAGGASCR